MSDMPIAGPIAVVVILIGCLLTLGLTMSRCHALVTDGEPERFELLQGRGDSILRIWRDKQTGKCYLVPGQGGIVEIAPFAAEGQSHD